MYQFERLLAIFHP